MISYFVRLKKEKKYIVVNVIRVICNLLRGIVCGRFMLSDKQCRFDLILVYPVILFKTQSYLILNSTAE